MLTLGKAKFIGTDGAMLEPVCWPSDRTPFDYREPIGQIFWRGVGVFVVLTVFGLWLVVLPAIGLLWCMGMMP